jgi:hypothetical protein
MAETLSTLAGFTKTMKEKPISGFDFIHTAFPLADHSTEKILMGLVRKKDVVTSNKIPDLQVMDSLTHEDSLLTVSRSSDVSRGATPIGELIRDAGSNLGVIQEDDLHVSNSEILAQTGALGSHSYSIHVPTRFPPFCALKYQEAEPRVWTPLKLTAKVETWLYRINTGTGYESGSLLQTLRPIIRPRAAVSILELGGGLSKARHS